MTLEKKTCINWGLFFYHVSHFSRKIRQKKEREKETKKARTETVSCPRSTRRTQGAFSGGKKVVCNRCGKVQYAVQGLRACTTSAKHKR